MSAYGQGPYGAGPYGGGQVEQVGPLTAARRDLAGILTAALAGHSTGAAVIDHVPEELPTPCVVIDAAEDYLSAGETYAGSEWWMSLQVYVLVDLASNAQATQDLEDILAVVLPVLARAAWQPAPIPRPGEFNTTTWLAHGVAINVRNIIAIT